MIGQDKRSIYMKAGGSQGMLESVLAGISEPDSEAMVGARERQAKLTKPVGALGMLEDIAVKVAGMTGRVLPPPGPKTVIIMAGDHGVVSEGVSRYPSEVTPQMVMNFLAGGAAINVIAGQAGADVCIVDVGVACDISHPDLVSRKVKPGTENMAAGPAMSRAEAVSAVEAGIEVARDRISGGAEFIAVGDMGIGNTTSASAITAAIAGVDPEKVTGRGTGIDDDALKHKVRVIRRALELNRPDPLDPLDVLSKVGGLEIAGITGVILACAERRKPVIIDGFISSSGALVAMSLCPLSRHFMLASHLSVEKGHRLILELIGLHPVLDAKMRLGEGTGAGLAFMIVDAALRLHAEMATFDEAGVSGPKDRKDGER